MLDHFTDTRSVGGWYLILFSVACQHSSCRLRRLGPKMNRHLVPSSTVSDRLESLSTSDGRYVILAIDHGRSLLSLLGHDESDDGPMREAKAEVLELLATHCTAVLIDVRLARTIGTLWRRPDEVQLIVGLDDFDYDDVIFPPPSVPSRELLREVRLAGATAAKIVLYYDPDTSDAAARCGVVAQIAERCHAEGLPLLVEPLPIPIAERDDRDPWPVAEVARRVSKTGADILKLPLTLGSQTADLAADITKAAAGTPWILLSSGAPYSEFLETLHLALLGGAAGFAAGRSIWSDLIVDVTNETARLEASQRLEGAALLTRSQRRAKLS